MILGLRVLYMFTQKQCPIRVYLASAGIVPKILCAVETFYRNLLIFEHIEIYARLSLFDLALYFLQFDRQLIFKASDGLSVLKILNWSLQKKNVLCH